MKIFGVLRPVLCTVYTTLCTSNAAKLRQHALGSDIIETLDLVSYREKQRLQ